MLIQERFSRNEWYKSTVQKLFYEVCLDRPDKTAIVYGGDNISYAALQDRVNRLAGSLLKLGIGKGDRVCMLPSPTPDFVCLYFAVLQIGAVINPLNLLWGQIEFTGVLRRNDPKAIVTVDQYGGRNYIQLLRDSIPDLELRGDSASSKSIPALARLICCSKEGKKHEGFLDFHSLIEGGAGYDKAAMHKQIMDAKPTDIQFICQTSGSTGLSKSALWDHRPPMERSICSQGPNDTMKRQVHEHRTFLPQQAASTRSTWPSTTAVPPCFLTDTFNPLEVVRDDRQVRCTARWASMPTSWR